MASQEAQTSLGNRLELSPQTTQPTSSNVHYECPDPSAHEHRDPSRLQDQAASAALHKPSDRSNGRNSSTINPLGPDGKLSSAGAAASLKYARREDLPSYPSVGIDTKNSGLGAASLAFANPSSPKYPDAAPTSSNAFKAANLANNHKVAPPWQPEASAAGSKAAMLAAQGKGRDWWQPTASKQGLQAATLATQNRNLGPQIYQGNTPDGKSKALQAATLSVKGRRRADSQPESADYPDRANATANSLKAAASAHGGGMTSRANEASRITHAKNLNRDMYTEHPQGLDYDKKERAHQDALKGASISMAQKLYAMEQVDDQGHVQLRAGRTAARNAAGAGADEEKDLKKQAMQYLTLQDAAQRLAAERLAKIDNQQEAEAFRDYYGYSGKRRSRLSILGGKSRRRASSEGAAFQRSNASTSANAESPPATPEDDVPHRRRNLDIDSDEEEEDARQAARIRSRQNNFNSQLAEADKKRANDQKTLMAAAERKVQSQMLKMDQKVFNDTGKMSPAMIDDWDNKARAKAVAASQARMVNHGRVNIGGGRFMDQSEIDAIARSNVQPTLDEIHETAEKQRARDEEVRLEREEAERVKRSEKEKEKERKDIVKKSKAEDKEAEKAKKRDARIAAEHDKTTAREEKERAKTAERDEKARQLETSKVHGAAVVQSSRKSVERQNESTRKSTSEDAHDTHQEVEDASQPSKSTDKKSPFKKLFGKSDKEPGKISMFDHKNKVSKIDSKAKEEKEKDGVNTKDVPLPPDGYALATGKLEDEQSASATDRPSTPADKGKQREVGSRKSSVELTPTGATMAGDGPATIAAPDREPETEQATETAPATATEGINTYAASTAVDNRTERPSTTATNDGDPSSPKKKRFSTLLGKFKRGNKDDKKERDNSDPAAFAGGVKLQKERHSPATDTPPASSSLDVGSVAGAAPTTAKGVSTAGAASGIHAAARSRSPSLVSSLSDSDDEERRGRSQTRLDRVAGQVLGIKDSNPGSSDEEGEFEEARDRFEGGALEPPRELLSKKHAESPVRDSRFVENI